MVNHLKCCRAFRSQPLVLRHDKGKSSVLRPLEKQIIASLESLEPGVSMRAGPWEGVEDSHTTFAQPLHARWCCVSHFLKEVQPAHTPHAE